MSILNVNKINPVGGGSTVTIAGIASVTNNISVGNSVTASSFHGNLDGNINSIGVSTFSGQIGIGTDNPGKTLDVRGIGGNFVAEISNTGTGANNNGVLFSTTNAASATIIFTASSGGSERLRITGDGHTLPGVDNTSDLGSSSKRWRNIYSADLQLSNVGTGGNEVDGTEGKWTLQEAENTVYMINRITGKRYKIKMEEV